MPSKTSRGAPSRSASVRSASAAVRSGRGDGEKIGDSEPLEEELAHLLRFVRDDHRLTLLRIDLEPVGPRAMRHVDYVPYPFGHLLGVGAGARDVGGIQLGGELVGQSREFV